MVALGVPLFWMGVADAGSNPAASVMTAVAGLGLIMLGVLCVRIQAGCDASEVWYRFAIGRRSATRPAVASYTWITSFSGRGSLLLFDTKGSRLLSLPSGFFADADIARLVQVLNVPQRRL